jgi:prepilin-type N-terminal cleavage/methylation domain-containing protein
MAGGTLKNDRPIIGEQCHEQAFTLIELSIVLVIIGLIVGGVLVGQNLIASAAIRAQITQIERFNQAVNTFFGKFRALPGDMDSVTAAQFGLPAHAGILAGNGLASNDGIIESYSSNQGTQSGTNQFCFETAQFWSDLSSAAAGNLIPGSYITGTCPNDLPNNIGSYLPTAALGNSGYVFVYSNNNANYYGLAAMTQQDPGDNVAPNWPSVTVSQAYAIDKKVDDGYPTTGSVTATAAGVALVYGAGAPYYQGASGTAATPGSAYTCYDNSANASGTPGVAGATQHYSLEMSSGNNNTCELSFRIQGGD